MKAIRRKFCFALVLLVGEFHLQAADSTNTATVVQESWETISNRWGSMPIEKIKQAAEKGEVTAQYYLGCANGDGNGVAQDQAEAFKWMKSAAQQGLARAQRRLGWMLQNGLGVETNLDEAVVWYQKAAERGDAQAQFNLGWMFENGVNVSQDYAEAAKFYRLAAEQGHTMAQNNLGWLYKNGWGVPEDQVEAVKWLQKSAEQGEPFAEKNLAWIYAAGEYGTSNVFGQGADAQIRSGGFAPNHELAEKWMRQAVDLNSAEGQCQFGDLLYGEFDNEGHQDTTRFSDAAEWYRKAAENGFAKAQYQLAEMYNTGKLGEEQRSNCIPWFLKAAAQGNADAQAEVGELPVLYPNNELLKSVDHIEILRRAAKNGNLDAQFQLARRYQAGIGVPKDAEEAFKWMQKAAQHSQDESAKASYARYYLAIIYEKGVGTDQDLQKAYRLYQEAANGRNIYSLICPDAMFRVGQMYEQGEGVPQDDQTATAYYAITFYYNDHPEKYPNGYLVCGGPTDKSIESLYRLWSQGRGLPSPDIKNLPGYRDPVDLIKYWDGLVNTAKAEFYLGKIYYDGKLIPQDMVEAAARFQVAAKQHSDDARKMLDEIEPKLSPMQKEDVKKRADNLEKQFEQTKHSEELLEKFRSVISW